MDVVYNDSVSNCADAHLFFAELKTEEDDVIGDTDEGVQHSNSRLLHQSNCSS